MKGKSIAPVLDGARITALRRDRHLGTEELARMAGLSATEIYRLEKGQRSRTAAVTLARVAAALCTSLEYLLGMVDDARSLHELGIQTTDSERT